MPIAVWGDEFAIGIEPLDRDHKRLLSLANKLHDALEAGEPMEVLGRVLAALNIYMNFHFATEEELFLRPNYPGSEAHLREHQTLAAAVEETRREFEKCPSEALPRQLLEFLKNWFYEHNLGADRALAEYLKANRAALGPQDSFADAGKD